MQALVVPKNRRPKFDLHFKIVDLNNVPYDSGRMYVRWHLSHSAGEHRGVTDKVPLKEHFVTWNYDTQTPVRMVVDKTGMLQDSHIFFEVYHEGDGLKSKIDRALLGSRKLNMAEYVEASELAANEDGICQRYLLHESKINGTIKICMSMKLIEGDRNFTAPPLKGQAMFGGIAGIMAADQRNLEEDDIPMISTKIREAGEDLRELYRRTLAADWTCRPGEPTADLCIEDIFAGGSGWGDRDGTEHLQPSARLDDPGEVSDGTLKSSKRNWSGIFSKRGHDRKRSTHEVSDRDDMSTHLRTSSHSTRGRGSFEQQTAHIKADVERRSKISNEVDEFKVRDDLRCWNSDRLPGKNI